jgi:hypothetical protein
MPDDITRFPLRRTWRKPTITDLSAPEYRFGMS